jgi:hypothetical protein
MRVQAIKDAINKGRGAKPYWHFNNDPRKVPEMKEILKILDDHKIPYHYGPTPMI